jgi:hypothetical protein
LEFSHQAREVLAVSSLRRMGATLVPRQHLPKGMHGYDTVCMPEMKAIFFAAGPDIQSGVTLEPFENVNVYPLIAKIPGLEISNLKTGSVDGKLAVLEGIHARSRRGDWQT